MPVTGQQGIPWAQLGAVAVDEEPPPPLVAGGRRPGMVAVLSCGDVVDVWPPQPAHGKTWWTSCPTRAARAGRES